MFDLLYRAAAIAVHGAAHSFQYAAPFMAAASASAALSHWRDGWLSPLSAALLSLAVLTAFGVPYVGAVLHTMLRGETPPFRDVLRWRRGDFDFLMFVAAAFLFGGMLTALVAEIAATIHDYAEALASRPSPEEKYGYRSGIVLFALFGSRTFAAIFFICALLLWSYFFRTALRIPAYMDGYDLRSEEAMTLTRHYRLQILAASLLMNTGLSAAAASAPWGVAEWWARAIMVGIAAWSFLHANLALSTAMYQKYTRGYKMRPLRKL